MEHKKTFYGVMDQEHLERIAFEVCECLGHGTNGKAIDILIETAGAETVRATLQDPTKFAGMGVTQFDKLPFEDIQNRTRQKDKDKILETFGINIEWVGWSHLRYNPLLAMIFTRLKYKKIPELIPNTFEDRSAYWKEHYNTKLGKGTIEHYIKSNKLFMQ